VNELGSNRNGFGGARDLHVGPVGMGADHGHVGARYPHHHSYLWEECAGGQLDAQGVICSCCTAIGAAAPAAAAAATAATVALTLTTPCRAAAAARVAHCAGAALLGLHAHLGGAVRKFAP
tara:strand:+ start:226 stop:588 length:363 start_codon:yes stop_codon:yes gene_type:complete